jgi:hypothetical protein
MRLLVLLLISQVAFADLTQDEFEKCEIAIKGRVDGDMACYSEEDDGTLAEPLNLIIRDKPPQVPVIIPSPCVANQTC